MSQRSKSEDEGSCTDQGTLVRTMLGWFSFAIGHGAELSFRSWPSCSLKSAGQREERAHQNVLPQCRPDRWAPGPTLTGGTHPCIKAINKIIVLVTLFQSSGLLAHPAAAKVSFLVVTGGDGRAPSGGLSGPTHQVRQPRTQQLPQAPDVAIKGCYWAVC